MKRNILIFSANNWNSPLKYQRHHLAEFLAEKDSTGNVYFFAKSAIRRITIKDFLQVFIRKFSKKKSHTRSKKDKIKLINYSMIPYQFRLFKGFFKNKFFNKIDALNLKPENTIIISYQPFPELIELVDKLRPIKFVYISVHDYENMTGVSKKVVETEQQIIKQADLFTTDSSSLFEKLSGKDISARLINLAPACPSPVVKKSKSSMYTKNKINKLIYFGTIAKYLDWDFMRSAAEQGFQIDFLGHEHDLNLSQLLPSSKRYSPTDFENAYEIFEQYDAIILPYLTNERNRHVIPAKIYECFSLGLPIFAPNMLWANERSIKGLVYTYDGLDDFLNKTREFSSSEYQTTRVRMLDVAEENSWDRRFEPLYKFIRVEK